MKINDYNLNLTYYSNKHHQFSRHEIWPNMIAQYNMSITYRSMNIVTLDSSRSGSYHTGVPTKMLMKYAFPLSPGVTDAPESIFFPMMSKNADLRPAIFKVLKDECKLVVRLPSSPYQYNFCKSLLSHLGVD